jgi:hypothetical protein
MTRSQEKLLILIFLNGKLTCCIICFKSSRPASIQLAREANNILRMFTEALNIVCTSSAACNLTAVGYIES